MKRVVSAAFALVAIGVTLASAGGSLSLASCSGTSCTGLPGHAADALEPAYATAADAGCTTASDCVVFDDSTLCAGGCGRVVAQSTVATLQAAVDDVNHGICAVFAANDCERDVPPCAQIAGVACVSGRCTEGATAVPVTTDGGVVLDASSD